MFFDKTWEEWILLYERSHKHPVNRLCHTIGIPLIVISIPLFVGFLIFGYSLIIPIVLFVIGWVFQFIGHIVEGKPPEFFKDWRFLFVGLRWWVAKMNGKV